MSMMMRLFLVVVFTVCSVSAQNRALLIGNNEYEYASDLANPINDVTAVAEKLRAEGWIVEPILKNGNLKQMKKAVSAFARLKAQKSLVYYAGHGIGIQKQSYLCPVDAELLDAGDQEVDTIELSWVLNKVTHAPHGIKLIVLDCCRDNPFQQRSWMAQRSNNYTMPRVNKELCKNGTIVFYSGAPGNAVPDGLGENSPFTKAFLSELDRSGRVSYMEFIGQVSQQVQNTQRPWFEIDGDANNTLAFTRNSLLPAQESENIEEPTQTFENTKALEQKMNKIIELQESQSQQKDERLKEMERELERLKQQEEKPQALPVESVSGPMPYQLLFDGASIRQKPYGSIYGRAISSAGKSLIGNPTQAVLNGGLRWIPVTWTGWMVEHNHKTGNQYIRRLEGNKAQVIWGHHDPKYNFVSLRTGHTTNHTQLAKLYKGTNLRILDSTKSRNYEWIQVRIDGWMAEYSSKGQKLLSSQ